MLILGIIQNELLLFNVWRMYVIHSLAAQMQWLKCSKSTVENVVLLAVNIFKEQIEIFKNCIKKVSKYSINKWIRKDWKVVKHFFDNRALLIIVLLLTTNVYQMNIHLKNWFQKNEIHNCGFILFWKLQMFHQFWRTRWKVIELHFHRSGQNLGLHVRYHLKKNCYKLRLSNAKTKNIGILLPNLFWPIVRKNCSSCREKLLKFETEGRELENAAY